MNRRIGISLAVFSVAVAYFVSLAFAEETRAVPQANPFAGKILTVYLDAGKQNRGQVLENAELKEIGGRMMLVGVGADTGQDGNWVAGVPVGIVWDSVETYYLMTKEEYSRLQEKFRR